MAEINLEDLMKNKAKEQSTEVAVIPEKEIAKVTEQIETLCLCSFAFYSTEQA